MNIQDIRPSCKVFCSGDTSLYKALISRQITSLQAQELLPDRATLGMVWRYLSCAGGQLHETPICLCRKIVRWSETPLSVSKLLTCLDVFADVGLLEKTRVHKYITLRLIPRQDKADLSQSRTLQLLQRVKES